MLHGTTDGMTQRASQDKVVKAVGLSPAALTSHAKRKSSPGSAVAAFPFCIALREREGGGGGWASSGFCQISVGIKVQSPVCVPHAYAYTAHA